MPYAKVWIQGKTAEKNDIELFGTIHYHKEGAIPSKIILHSENDVKLVYARAQNIDRRKRIKRKRSASSPVPYYTQVWREYGRK